MLWNISMTVFIPDQHLRSQLPGRKRITEAGDRLSDQRVGPASSLMPSRVLGHLLYVILMEFQGFQKPTCFQIF